MRLVKQLTGLTQGAYTVSEIQAPDGYLINTQAQVLVLNEQSAYQGQLVLPMRSNQVNRANQANRVNQVNRCYQDTLTRIVIQIRLSQRGQTAKLN
ncbi:prealbumin-like fold domain-containing protein [Lactiplantibacillus plantarum]|nr:prealbumin-like fold domain-containing protein [Lactiplantibacillus plantarum]